MNMTMKFPNNGTVIATVIVVARTAVVKWNGVQSVRCGPVRAAKNTEPVSVARRK